MSAFVYNIDNLKTGTVEPLVATTCHGQPVLQNAESSQVKSLYLEPLVSNHLLSNCVHLTNNRP